MRTGKGIEKVGSMRPVVLLPFPVNASYPLSPDIDLQTGRIATLRDQKLQAVKFQSNQHR